MCAFVMSKQRKKKKEKEKKKMQRKRITGYDKLRVVAPSSSAY